MSDAPIPPESVVASRAARGRRRAAQARHPRLRLRLPAGPHLVDSLLATGGASTASRPAVSARPTPGGS